MDEKVGGFPFNLVNDPMYLGSSLLFLARGLWELKIMGPFTESIYAQRALKKKMSK